jgi:hypothetical protein
VADDDAERQLVALLEAQLLESRQQQALLFEALTRVLSLVDQAEGP